MYGTDPNRQIMAQPRATTANPSRRETLFMSVRSRNTPLAPMATPAKSAVAKAPITCVSP